MSPAAACRCPQRTARAGWSSGTGPCPAKRTTESTGQSCPPGLPDDQRAPGIGNGFAARDPCRGPAPPAPPSNWRWPQRRAPSRCGTTGPAALRPPWEAAAGWLTTLCRYCAASAASPELAWKVTASSSSGIRSAPRLATVSAVRFGGFWRTCRRPGCHPEVRPLHLHRYYSSCRPLACEAGKGVPHDVRRLAVAPPRRHSRKLTTNLAPPTRVEPGPIRVQHRAPHASQHWHSSAPLLPPWPAGPSRLHHHPR
mmetsp:Transcript_19661/g.43620  ORF Transcript_19661/g.43620 Transcript_19661/m.43620 type:complete len:254 (-) Transcript_19661:1078-1839(-)